MTPDQNPARPDGDALDRQYMGTAVDAKTALLEKTRAWRETRQPSMATSAEHRKSETLERQLRFELANAALLWLWHEEHPAAAPAEPTQCCRGLAPPSECACEVARTRTFGPPPPDAVEPSE